MSGQAALRILSAGLEGVLSDGRGREDAGGGQLEGDVRTDCKLAGSLLPDLQTYYFLSTIVLRNSKKKKKIGCQGLKIESFFFKYKFNTN